MIKDIDKDKKAFASNFANSSGDIIMQQGMSLRVYIASMVLPALITSNVGGVGVTVKTLGELVTESYAYADNMLLDIE